MSISPEGAQRLRDVRDYIVANPDEFDWSQWCGSRCCIGGHLARRFVPAELVGALNNLGTGPVALRALGVAWISADARTQWLLNDLLYGYAIADARDTALAAKKINYTLLAFGYPPDPVEAPVEARVEELVGV